MTLWHVPWDYIYEHWTDEQYNLMCLRAAERIQEQESATRRGNWITEEEALASGRFTHGD